MKRTPLYDEHVALGARIVPFAGFGMPVQYAGILQEHDAVRHRAGLFDLSHMAQFELRGDGVGAWADALTVNVVSTMNPGGARYNLFCNESGGTHDDVIFYRRAERWLLVCNASNADKMWDLLSGAPAEDVVLDDRRAVSALIALQGPRSVEILQALVDGDVAALRYYSAADMTVCGRPALVARTGYTGEDGFELFTAAEDAVAVWRAVLDAGRPAGLEPAGLGARDVLRLEAGMPLYGHELAEDVTPLQAGLAWAVKFEKPRFTGKAALERQHSEGRYRRNAGLVMTGRAVARQGYDVIHKGKVVGDVRSGSVGPSVGRNIATALLEPEVTKPGTRLSIRIRDAEHEAEVAELPFYKRGRR
jgi:aminomethyltransferase